MFVSCQALAGANHRKQFRRTTTASTVFSPSIFACVATTYASSSSSSSSTTALFGAAASTSTSGNNNVSKIEKARQLVVEGENAFKECQIDLSVQKFDDAIALFPDGSLTPFLWQRGISLYYADRLDDASRQFRTDVKVNPNDAEEIVWDVASRLRLQQGHSSGKESFPVPDQMSLPAGGRNERRQVMKTVYKLFRGEIPERDLALMVGTRQGPTSASDEFYALFYLGLYCEGRGETSKAENYMRQSLKTQYARSGRRDYMVSVAKVSYASEHIIKMR